MKHLIQHLVDQNLKKIAEDSKRDCHAKGLHSIMLLNSPSQTIRIFITDREHTLWRNLPGSNQEMSVGFHPHHCDITLLGIYGCALNWTVAESKGNALDNIAVNRFRYFSQLLGDEPRFKKEREANLRTLRLESILPDNPIAMAAQEIHTVAVMKGEIAAWFVFEGRENKNHTGITYSNTDLENHSFFDLYNPMGEKEVLLHLSFLDLIWH